jgi:hypothetical protein
LCLLHMQAYGSATPLSNLRHYHRCAATSFSGHLLYVHGRSSPCTDTSSWDLRCARMVACVPYVCVGSCLPQGLFHSCFSGKTTFLAHDGCCFKAVLCGVCVCVCVYCTHAYMCICVWSFEFQIARDDLLWTLLSSLKNKCIDPCLM